MDIVDIRELLAKSHAVLSSKNYANHFDDDIRNEDMDI